MEPVAFPQLRTELRYAADVPTATVGVSAATGEPSATWRPTASRSAIHPTSSIQQLCSDNPVTQAQQTFHHLLNRRTTTTQTNNSSLTTPPTDWKLPRQCPIHKTHGNTRKIPDSRWTRRSINISTTRPSQKRDKTKCIYLQYPSKRKLISTCKQENPQHFHLQMSRRIAKLHQCW